MNRFVITCPVSKVALLSDLKVHTDFLEHSANTLLSVYCPACDAVHTMRLRQCKHYPIKSGSRELQKAS
jgi:hypothetical protein